MTKQEAIASSEFTDAFFQSDGPLDAEYAIQRVLAQLSPSLTLDFARLVGDYIRLRNAEEAAKPK